MRILNWVAALSFINVHIPTNAYRCILHKYDIESGQAPDGRTVESSNMAIETD